MRDQYLFFRSADFEQDPHQLVGDETSGRIWKAGPHEHRVGAAIHRNVDEIDLTRLVINRPIGVPDSDVDVLGVDGMATLLGAKEIALAHREGHIHRILTDNHRQSATVRTHDIALRYVCASDLTGNRRDDLSVTEIDLRREQVGFVGHDGPLCLTLGGDGFVEGLGRADIFFEELFLPFSVLHRQYVLCLAALQCALGLFDRGLEQSFLDAIERGILRDQVALREHDSLQISFHPGSDFHAIDRLDASDKVHRLGYQFTLGFDRADRNGRWLLCQRRGGKSADHDSHIVRQAHCKPPRHFRIGPTDFTYTGSVLGHIQTDRLLCGKHALFCDIGPQQTVDCYSTVEPSDFVLGTIGSQQIARQSMRSDDS